MVERSRWDYLSCVAQRFERIDVEWIKAQNSFLEVASELGLEIIRNRFRCPASENHVHGDRTPSVTFWPDRNFFKCWVCPEVKGDVIDLVRLVKKMSFTKACHFLSKRAPPPHLLNSSSPQKVSIPFKASTFSPQTELLDEIDNAATLEKTVSTPVPSWDLESESMRQEVLKSFLDLCVVIKGPASTWLRKRRIFVKTWTSQGLRMVGDYAYINQNLRQKFSLQTLQKSGLFNVEGHLRYYRHPLILPYFDDQGKVVYVQGRALDPLVKPKELSLGGPIPCPYNAVLLNGIPGILYLGEGVIDTLTLLEAGFPAVGIPGATNFKNSWVPLFKNKQVYIAFDADIAGEAGANKTMALLAEGGVEAHRVVIPMGKDINELLVGGVKKPRP